MKRFAERRLKLALPFTVLTAPDTVKLSAGEDFRYTMEAGGLDAWLPRLLESLDGSRTVETALAHLDAARGQAAAGLLAQLYGERVLVDATAAEAHEPARFAVTVEGSGPLCDAVGAMAAPPGGRPLLVLCQDRLDYHEALTVNRRCRAEQIPWLWVTTGPMGRGYAGPVFLPGAGPCAGCLLAQFRRLSPAPEFYDMLVEHVRDGGRVEPVPFPDEGVAVLARIAAWKIRHLADPEPPAAIYELHALETATFEVSVHRIAIDLECPECEAAP